MKKHYAGFSFIIAVSFIASIALAEGNVHWDYSETGHTGPTHWGELDPNFSMCSSGKNQSPVDLTAMVESNLSYITFGYKAGGYEVLNNGHTIQVNYEPGSTISVDGHEFELKQFHFHNPSENTINGKFWPMEAHFVHADQEGNLAVIAVMFKTGDENSELQKAWASLPDNAGEKNALSEKIDAVSLLPEKKDFYRFNGSLTTPPCSEGVLWLVMKDDLMASVDQIQRFAQIMQHPNNRPVQPKNARLILK